MERKDECDHFTIRTYFAGTSMAYSKCIRCGQEFVKKGGE